MRLGLELAQVSVPQAFSELKGCLGGWERSLTQVRSALSRGTGEFR